MESDLSAAPKCAVHPSVVARRSPCARCGNFTCEGCFEHPAHDLCASCSVASGHMASDLLLTERARRQRRWTRKNPRLYGLVTMAAGLGCVALNLVLIFALDRTYVVMFPLGGTALGIGLTALLTGRAGPMRLADAPASYWLLAIGLAVGGLLGGVALDFVVG